MGKSRSFGWIAGAVVVMIAMFALTYFLLYSPKAEAAESSRSEAADVRSRNDLLRIQNAQLRADYEKLDEYRAHLAELALEIPVDRDWDTVEEMIEGFALEAGLSTPLETTVSDGTALMVFQQPGAAPPAEIDPEGTVSDAEAEVTGAEGDAGTAQGDGATPPASPGIQNVPGLTMVPFSVKMAGPYENVLTFLNLMQEHDGRLFLIPDFEALRQKATDATPLRAEVADGDLEITVRGYFFSLLPTGASQQQGEEEPGGPVPEQPGTGTNPFAPLEPSR